MTNQTLSIGQTPFEAQGDGPRSVPSFMVALCPDKMTLRCNRSLHLDNFEVQLLKKTLSKV